jgi:hypothetical protein
MLPAPNHNHPAQDIHDNFQAFNHGQNDQGHIHGAHFNPNGDQEVDQMVVDDNPADLEIDSISVHDFTLQDSENSTHRMEAQHLGWQIIPYGLPQPVLPIGELPFVFCQAVTMGVFRPLLMAFQPLLFKSVDMLPRWSLITLVWNLSFIPSVSQHIDDSPSPAKRRRISKRGSKAAKALPFSAPSECSTIQAQQPARKMKKKSTPVSVENLRRSPRFVAQKKSDFAPDKPKKKSKVQPIASLLTPDGKGLPPPVPVQQLQKIGTDNCGMLPEEVTTNKLLKPRK